MQIPLIFLNFGYNVFHDVPFQMKVYNLLQNGKVIQTRLPATLAGWRQGKIFGRLDCKSGMRMKKENRVFFLSLEDAVKEGYRPCKNCKPINEDDFEKLKHLVPYKTLLDFYNRDKSGAKSGTEMAGR